jgi:DnaJ-class molecular chaperone
MCHNCQAFFSPVPCLQVNFSVLGVHYAEFFFTNFFSFFGGGGGMEEEEEQIIKGDEVIVELEASLEDLYMGGSLKVKYIF